MASACTVAADQTFGPAVKCGQFDFTLFFEQSIFGIGISSLFLLFVPFRIAQLYRAEIKTLWNSMFAVKIVGYHAVSLRENLTLLGIFHLRTWYPAGLPRIMGQESNHECCRGSSCHRVRRSSRNIRSCCCGT